MWAWIAIGAALAQGDGAPEDRAVGAEGDTMPEALPEPWRPLTSYAYLEPGVVAGVRPASPLGVEWEEALPFRPVVMPEALGDIETGNPLRPIDWSGTPTVSVTAPIPSPGASE